MFVQGEAIRENADSIDFCVYPHTTAVNEIKVPATELEIKQSAMRLRHAGRLPVIVDRTDRIRRPERDRELGFRYAAVHPGTGVKLDTPRKRRELDLRR